MMRFAYKTYKESFAATMFSAFGSMGVFFGLVVFVLLFLPKIGGDLTSPSTLIIGAVVLVLIVGGICGIRYAPRHAEKAMRKRISADFEYAKYIVKEYPQYIALVKELQPSYREGDREEIIDYEKKKQEIPLWRRLIGIAMLIAIAYIFYKLNVK